MIIPVLPAQAKRILLSLPILVMLAGSPMAADEVTKWSEVANRLAFDLNPLYQSRILAMTHTAMHDALSTLFLPDTGHARRFSGSGGGYSRIQCPAGPV